MCSSGKPAWRRSLKCLLVFACTAGVAPGVASAQEGKLSVQASPQVLYSGQSANVDVFAHFASLPAPNGAYAFASSVFDVYATVPAWSIVSAGAIVGDDVLGASFSQTHLPQSGTLADPSNPIHVWHGVFEPQSNAPALIEIEADPTDFSVYPSELTSSSAPCDAEGGSGFLFVNPLRAGRWLAAPAEGTSIQISDDVVIDGRIITGENWDSVAVGLFPPPVKTYRCPSDTRVSVSGRITGITADNSDTAPAVNGDDSPVEEVSFSYAKGPSRSSTRVGFDQPPSSFAATVQVVGGPRNGAGNAQLQTYLELELSETMLGTYEVAANAGGANFLLADGHVRFEGYLGGIRVASGDFGGDGQTPALVVNSLPHTFDASAGGGKVSWSYNDVIVKCTLRYDQPVLAVVRGANGRPRAVTIDRIELHAVQGAAAPIRSQNNLKQIGLGCHVFEAMGVERMTLTPMPSE